MTKNTISIELPQLDKLDQLEKLETVVERLDVILATMQNLTAPLRAPRENPQETLECTESESKESPTPATEVCLSDLQRIIVELSGTNLKAQARAIVKSYAERVSEIPADKWHEVWEKLTALEA